MQDIEKTIAANKRRVYKQMIKFGLAGDQDAESLGFEALHNAILTFDETKNVKFSTYSTVCIYNALGNYLRTMQRKRQLDIVSYNAIAYESEEFINLLPGAPSTEDAYIQDTGVKYIHQIIDEELSKLTNPIMSKVVDIWVSSEFTEGTKEIANEVGISQSYVSQILNRFRYSLRKRLEEYNA